MIKRLIIFVLAIAGILYFALRDDAKAPEVTTEVGQETETSVEETQETTDGENDSVTQEGGEVEEEKAPSSEQAMPANDKKEGTTTATPVTETKTEAERETTIETKVEGNVTASSELKATETAEAEKTLRIEESFTTEMSKKQEPVNMPTTEVKIFLYEWAIDVSQSAVPAGTVNFTVVNTGSFSHNFGIKGGTDFGRVKPGETKTFTAQLKRGEFELMSSREVDIERGMKKMFSVQ